MLNAFTVDVEDYFQVSAFEHVVNRDQWDQQPSRVEANTERLLGLLKSHDVTGTFFVLGWTAEKYPKLVRKIADAGHELACHSFWHQLIYRQTPEEFRSDLRRAKNAIEDAGGQRVVAYRAPSFSITKRSVWALEVLVEEGFEVDSSIFPVVHDRYGMPEANRRIHPINTPAGVIWEFPMSVVRVGPISVPVSGGGYFRLFPLGFSKLCLRSANRCGQPFSFYIHPWEVDADQPRMPGISRITRFRHYVNLNSTERKLERLLKSFSFGTISDVVARQREMLAGTNLASELVPLAAGEA